MRLTDLHAEFVGNAGLAGGSFRHLPSGDGAQGVLFNCPASGCDHGLIVWFRNPIGAPPVDAAAEPRPRWEREGETIDTLTLSPSVDAGCWHGWVRDGEAS